MRFFDARICIFIRTRFEFVLQICLLHFIMHQFVFAFICRIICVYWLYVLALVCKRLHMSHVFAVFAPNSILFLSFVRDLFTYCTYITFWAQSIPSFVCIFAFALWLCCDDVQHKIEFVYWCGFLQDCKINIIFMFACKRFDFDSK